MGAADGVDRPTEIDPYATRVPSPESLEAMGPTGDSTGDEGSRGRGAVPGVTREDYERGLAECRFLDSEGLRALVESLPEVERPRDVESLARFLVRSGKLTRYQASALFQGKGKALLIGPYVVLDKLGSGGMGMVFKARLRDGGPDVALKLLPPSASKKNDAVRRFRREAEIMARLDHTHIVSSHHIGEYLGLHYLVMDYVEGRDLDRIVRTNGPLKVARAVDTIIQAARGLAAAHANGIVHRDIKPANLLLDAKGIIRVLDLGLARINQADDSIEGPEKGPSLTQSGIIMGTVDFLPPEQSDDSKRADHRADIYSLGCTLHFLLTGKPPYSGESIMQRLIAHHQKPIPSLVEARPDVPPEVDAIFRRMLAKAPEDRPRSIVEVIEALESWRGSTTGSKSLRVFDDAGASKSVVASPVTKPDGRDRPRSADRKPVEDPERYDLMTFVRTELLEADSDEEPTNLAPIPSRKPKGQDRRTNWTVMVVRGLVAAAAIVVLVRFFPTSRSASPEGATRAAPAVVETPAAVPVPAPTPIPPVVVEAPKPKIEPTPTPTPDATKVAEQPKDGPPPRPLLEQFFGPPPDRGPPPPRPGPPPPPRKGGRPPGPPMRQPFPPPDGRGGGPGQL